MATITTTWDLHDGSRVDGMGVDVEMRQEDTGTTRERPCPRLIPIPPLGKDEMEDVNGSDERKQE